jgi:PIN domain nuclease of toxin-antitoxin system
MRLLLDTHSFLWFISGSPRLSVPARQAIEDPDNISYLSSASLWEMAIKVSLGKLSLAQPFETLIPQQLALNGIEILDITIAHTALVAQLPFHHRDPFDRLLLAQAQVERMPIIGNDPSFDAYGIARIW